MSVTVNFEKPVGTYIYSRSFDPGDKIRVSGKVIGSPGIGEWGVSVTIEIDYKTGTLTFNDVTSIFGNYGVDFVLPYVNTDAMVTVTAYRQGSIFGGIDIEKVPIGIGIPEEDIPKPPDIKSDWDRISLWIKLGIITGGAVVGLVVVTNLISVMRPLRANPRYRRIGHTYPRYKSLRYG